MFKGAELKIILWVFKSKTNKNLEREREFSLPGHNHQAVISKTPKKEAVMTSDKEGRNSMYTRVTPATKEKMHTQYSRC